MAAAAASAQPARIVWPPQRPRSAVDDRFSLVDILECGISINVVFFLSAAYCSVLYKEAALDFNKAAS